MYCVISIAATHLHIMQSQKGSSRTCIHVPELPPPADEVEHIQASLSSTAIAEEAGETPAQDPAPVIAWEEDENDEPQFTQQKTLRQHVVPSEDA